MKKANYKVVKGLFESKNLTKEAWKFKPLFTLPISNIC